MRDLITEWPRIKKELRTKPVLLLISYEGTLVTPPPSSSHLEQNIREVLVSLRSKPSVTVGIISGIPLTSLQNLIRIKGMYYSGNHGLEIRGPDMEFVHPACSQAACSQDGLEPVKTFLQQKLSAIDEIFIEDSGLSLALYYPSLGNSQRELLKETVSAGIQSYVKEGKLRTVERKDSLEILPVVNWDKGRVVKMFENMLASRKAHPLTMYFGSERTDEEAFRAVREKGMGVLVGKKNKTAAGYYLNGYDEVADFLLLLESFY